jgi:hypothetical protein
VSHEIAVDWSRQRYLRAFLNDGAAGDSAAGGQSAMDHRVAVNRSSEVHPAVWFDLDVANDVTADIGESAFSDDELSLKVTVDV